MREASVVARQATAIERGGRAAAESIRDRAVKERNKSRAEASETKAQLSSAAAHIHEHESNIKLQLDLRRESYAVLATTRAELCDQQEVARKQESSEASAGCMPVPRGCTGLLSVIELNVPTAVKCGQLTLKRPCVVTQQAKTFFARTSQRGMSGCSLLAVGKK